MKKYLVLRIILLVGIFGTLLFTFVQSALPYEDSSVVSDEASGFLSHFISPDTPFGEFVHQNLRKIAHFAEYFMLGAFTSLYVIIFMPSVDAVPKERARFSVYSLFLAPLVALFDETIQIFSSRGPSVSDIWIDVFGFFVSSTVVYVLFYLIKYFKGKGQA